MLVAMEAAFFDLDKTVIASASTAALSKQLRQEGLITRRILARFLWSNIIYMQFGASQEKLERVRANILTLIQGWDQQRIREIVREAIDEVITPIIYEEAFELIKEHRSAGRKVVIVSASPAEIVEPLAMHLGAQEAICTRVRVDSNGKYTNELDFYAQGSTKADAMEAMSFRDGIDLEHSYAYSDSVTDLPMLECVGHPVVVNPDRALLRIANQRKWEVRRFHHPMPLAKRSKLDRVATRKSAGKLAIAGVILSFALLIRHFWRKAAKL